jgi:hypothetical protein
MLLRVWSLFGTFVKLLRFAAMFWPLGIDGVIIFLVPGITRLEVVVLEKRTDCSPKRQVAESDDVTRKPPLVSLMHYVSYHCSQSTIGSSPSKGIWSFQITSLEFKTHAKDLNLWICHCTLTGIHYSPNNGYLPQGQVCASSRDPYVFIKFLMPDQLMTSFESHLLPPDKVYCSMLTYV